MQTLNEASVSKRTLPVNLQQRDLNLFQHELEKTIPPTSLLHMANVDIYPSGMLVHDGQILEESFASPANLTSKVKLKFLVERLRSRDCEFLDDKAVWCTDNWSAGYFHWMTDTLPRLYSVRDQLTDATLLLPGNYQRIEYVTSSLVAFPVRKIKFVNNWMRCKNLLIPSHTAPTGNYNEDMINGVRKHYIDFYGSSTVSDSDQRIYISRGKAGKRKIANERECLAVLEKYGFKILYFEELSFSQQVAISMNARFMISNHGAGLTNMLFMSRGCSVYELRKVNDHLNNCYFALASALGLGYYYQLCETEVPEQTGNTANIIVDLDLLEKTIESMLANDQSFDNKRTFS